MNSIEKYFSDFILVTKTNTDKIKTTDLLKSYHAWKSLHPSEDYFNQTSLNSALEDLGFPKRKLHGDRYFVGIKFKVNSPQVEPKVIIPSSCPTLVTKEILETKVEVIPSKVKVLSQETIVPKKNFILFSDFILHIPTFIAVKGSKGLKGSYPNNISFLLSYSFKLNTVVDLLTNHDVHNLSVYESGNLYFNFPKLLQTMNEKKLSLENSVILLFSTGFDFARFRFGRNLLVCDSYDEFSSYCKNNSLLI